MSRVFRSPARYVQGRGATAEVGAHATQFGDRALVVGDDLVLDLVGDRLVSSLEDYGVEATTETFGGECSNAEIDRLTDVAADRGAGVVVGAGGGKALDAAKGVRAERGGAMVSVPTIASTDAPTSALSVVYTEAGEFEEYWFHDEHPDLVVVDTAVVAAAPTRLFRGGVADALATWFEADATARSDGDTVVGGTPTRAGTHLAKLCYETLREYALSAVEAVDCDAVTESVKAVTEANTLLSGLGFESGGLAAAHSIHNGLTRLEATHDATHGEKVNVGTITQLVLEGREDAFVDEILDFSLDVGLPVTLAEIGLDDPTRDQLDVVAEAACADEETIHNEPFAVDPPMVRDALLAADRLGERAHARRS
jgi:glycerol dehydrogenase